MVFRQKRRDSEVNGGVKAWLSRCFEVVASAGSREFVVSAKPGWCDSKPFVNGDPWVVISGDPARASAQELLRSRFCTAWNEWYATVKSSAMSDENARSCCSFVCSLRKPLCPRFSGLSIFSTYRVDNAGA